MATYAIGDVQGCYDELRRLLDQVRFDPHADRLWFAGDLVNRGPYSLQTLRFVKSLGERAVTVLGNHDLHLLAVAHGGRPGRRDTLDEVLRADDRDELLDWLRRQPLLHAPEGSPYALLHAGLPPQWTLANACRYAREVETRLSSDDYVDFLTHMYGDEPHRWNVLLRGMSRLRFIVNCFTRLRYCRRDGSMELKEKGAPGSQPKDLVPWFMAPRRRSADTILICGHWSTLGRVHWPEHKVYGLDTGCVWGQRLTALRLEDGSLHSVRCERRSGWD
jgi:bis(5'-nucleosyl)-tetraphosphatase (symmetrical)